MQLDDEVCLCFHVTKRKLLNYIRVERPRRPAQLSDCFGAGTGCGWCRAYLERLFVQATSPALGTSADAAADPPAEEPSAEQYAQGRSAYVRSGRGTPPPGATPID